MGLYLDMSVSQRAGLCGPIPRPVSQYLTGQGCVSLYLDPSVSHRAGLCEPIPRPISISQGRAV